MPEKALPKLHITAASADCGDNTVQVFGLIGGPFLWPAGAPLPISPEVFCRDSVTYFYWGGEVSLERLDGMNKFIQSTGPFILVCGGFCSDFLQLLFPHALFYAKGKSVIPLKW